MFKGVVFDFDGVIVDSHAVHMRAWRKFFELIGCSVSEAQLQFVMDGRKREEILRHFLGDLDPRLAVEYGRQKELIFRTEAADVRPIEGLIHFLNELKHVGLPLGVASSGSRNRVSFLLGKIDLKRYFRVIVTGDDVENGKPDPAVFLRAAQDLGINPAELIAFEDAVSGVKAAKAAGMKCVGIVQAHRASILRNAGADHVVADFREMSYARLHEVCAS